MTQSAYWSDLVRLTFGVCIRVECDLTIRMRGNRYNERRLPECGRSSTPRLLSSPVTHRRQLMELLSQYACGIHVAHVSDPPDLVFRLRSSSAPPAPALSRCRYTPSATIPFVAPPGPPYGQKVDSPVPPSSSPLPRDRLLGELKRRGRLGLLLVGVAAAGHGESGREEEVLRLVGASCPSIR